MKKIIGQLMITSGIGFLAVLNTSSQGMEIQKDASSEVSQHIRKAPPPTTPIVQTSPIPADHLHGQGIPMPEGGRDYDPFAGARFMDHFSHYLPNFKTPEEAYGPELFLLQKAGLTAEEAAQEIETIWDPIRDRSLKVLHNFADELKKLDVDDAK